jgi:hypothetical protein
MNIARMMEQRHQPQPPPINSSQQSDIETMQHVQNQVLHFYHLHTNQQQHLVQQPPPPPPQLPTTLQIANILASKGQLPQDPNQAAALVATYYYTNFLSRTQQTNNIPLSSNVNTNVYETINTQQTNSNSDKIPLSSGRKICSCKTTIILFYN